MIHCSFMENGLKKMRERAELTQAQLAEAADVSQHYISILEAGKKNLNLKRVKQFANILDCSEAEIWGYPVTGQVIPLLPWDQLKPFTEDESYDAKNLVIQGSSEGKLALEVEGNSMYNIAPAGSVIVVDTFDRELKDGGLYVFLTQDKAWATFRRFRNEPPRLEPESTISDYGIMHIDNTKPDRDWKSVGRVVEIRIFPTRKYVEFFL